MANRVYFNSNLIYNVNKDVFDAGKVIAEWFIVYCP